MKKHYLLILFIAFISCSVTKQVLNADKPVDYSKETNWAALPTKQDPSDLDPNGLKPAEDGPVDVFFLYPTSFLDKKDLPLWNASIDNQKINKATDESSIKYQASIFNQVGRVYAPRYRQANYFAYFTPDKTNADKAFELAYGDIKNAFQYYLDHFNQGRPIIIAGHSQGTTHGMRLVKDFFDGTPLQAKLVAANLAGIPIPQGYFKTLNACNSPDDLGCINSWRSFEYGYIPKFVQMEKPTLITNPVSWSTDTTYVPKEKNKGAVLRKFNGGVLKGIADAQIHQNILWIHKPKFPGSFLYRSKNYHIADFNFFYMDVRENAIHRRDLYLGKKITP
jgi:hypothetical protein